MTGRKLSTLCRATSVVPSKVNVASGHFLTCSSSLSKICLTLSSSALLIVSLQSLQWKISILNHGGAVTGEGTGLRGGGERVINAKCLSFFGAAVAVLLLPSA